MIGFLSKIATDPSFGPFVAGGIALLFAFEIFCPNVLRDSSDDLRRAAKGASDQQAAA
jgi:hypothetical protein